jgi:superfamily II DNA or RNA helicase
MGSMLKVILGATLKIDVLHLKEMNPRAYKYLRLKFKRKNPDWLNNEKFNYSNHATPEFIYAYRKKGRFYYFPRGTRKRLIQHLKRYAIEYKLVNTIPDLDEPNPYMVSKVTLRPDQQVAQDLILDKKEGVWIAYPSFGKTVLVLDTICKLGQISTIGVHSIDSQKQWIQEILTHTKIPKGHIGGVGGIFKKPKVGLINVCTEHSLAKAKYAKHFAASTKFLALDETQKLASTSFNTIPQFFNCPYRIGVSASIQRADGKKFLILEALGNVQYTAKDKDSDSKIKSRILMVKSGYKNDDYAWGGSRVDLVNDMSMNLKRNSLIIQRVMHRVSQKKLVLILVERRVHVAILSHLLLKNGIDARIIMANSSNKALQEEIKNDFPNYISKDIVKKFLEYDADVEVERIKELAYHKKIDVIIGTQKAFVGMSIKTIDVGVIATPTGMNYELFNQKVGRVERSYGNDKYLLDTFGTKPTPIVEYIWDYKIGPLNRSGENLISNYPRKFKILVESKGE